MAKINSVLMRGVAVGVSLLLSGGANAAAYSVSTNSISNFGISFTNAPTFSAFPFNGNTAAVNGTSQSNAGVMNAASSCVGCSYMDSFTPHGASAISYAYGDSQITNSNILTGVGAANSIGEVYLGASSPATAYAHGINTMSGSLYVPTSTVMTFNFFATPNLEATLASGGQWAAANMAMTVTLSQGSQTIFSWAPNGVAGGVNGGIESMDPFNLNISLARLTNGTSPYNPGTGQFQAKTNVLGSGVYNLNISMSNTAQAQTVPVPAAVWLFGSGFIALVGVARRRYKSA